MDVVGRMRARDLRLERADVDRDHALVDGVGVGPFDDERPIGAFFDVGDRLFVGVEDSVLRAGLDRHVRHRDATGNRKLVDGRSVILDRAIGRAVDAELADGAQHDVLRVDHRSRRCRCRPA